jgi:hypothetical protein
MLKRSGLRDLDIASVGIEIEAAIPIDVEIPASPTVLIQLDLARTAHIHIGFALSMCKHPLKWQPVRLSNFD